MRKTFAVAGAALVLSLMALPAAAVPRDASQSGLVEKTVPNGTDGGGYMEIRLPIFDVDPAVPTTSKMWIEFLKPNGAR